MDKVKYIRIGIYSYIYYTPLDIFMGANPPCKECLIQPMCIRDDRELKILTVKSCDRLNEFAKNNYWFDMS